MARQNHAAHTHLKLLDYFVFWGPSWTIFSSLSNSLCRCCLSWGTILRSEPVRADFGWKQYPAFAESMWTWRSEPQSHFQVSATLWYTVGNMTNILDSDRARHESSQQPHDPTMLPYPPSVITVGSVYTVYVYCAYNIDIYIYILIVSNPWTHGRTCFWRLRFWVCNGLRANVFGNNPRWIYAVSLMVREVVYEKQACLRLGWVVELLVS